VKSETVKRKRGGRKKGVPNKITGDVKAMIEGALAAAGGQQYLTRQAEESPAAFMKLVGMLLPKDMHLKGQLEIAFSERMRAILERGSDERGS
jgi:hypothetical protein